MFRIHSSFHALISKLWLYCFRTRSLIAVSTR